MDRWDISRRDTFQRISVSIKQKTDDELYWKNFVKHGWKNLKIIARMLRSCLEYTDESEEEDENSSSSSVGNRTSNGRVNQYDNSCKRRKLSAFPLKDKIKQLINTTARIAESHSALYAVPSIEECMVMVHSMEGIEKESPFYSYVCTFLCDKDARKAFGEANNATLDFKWLMYNYEIWQSKNPHIP